MTFLDDLQTKRKPATEIKRSLPCVFALRCSMDRRRGRQRGRRRSASTLFASSPFLPFNGSTGLLTSKVKRRTESIATSENEDALGV